MFATLDPTVRHITLPSKRRALVSDTVGFIRNLPTTLVRAFRATLEEVTEAELLLHVVDASSAEAAHHTAHVLATLNEIGAASTPQILVLNKADLIGEHPDVAALARRILGDPEHQPAGAVAISAATGAGFAGLLEKIDEILSLDPVSPFVFRFPISEGASLHLLHEYAQVSSIRYDEDGCEVEAMVPESIKRRLERFLVPHPALQTPKL
jgi:GTPase